jgi:hypothetical protein
MIEADACSDRSLRLGRIVPCIDACEAIEAGVDASDSAALLRIAYIARCSVEQSDR